MTMPRPEDILAELDKIPPSGGTAASTAPKGAAGPPAGSVMRGATAAIDPNGMWWYGGANGWTQGYAASQADRQAAGIGPVSTPRAGTTGTGTGTRDFTAEKAATQAAGGGTANPPAWVAPGATRAVDKSGLTVWTKDPTTQLWINAGFPPNAADKANAARIAGGITPTAQPQTSTQTATQPQQPQILDPLKSNQAPTYQSQLLQNAVVPGAQQSQTDTRTLSLGNALNQIAVRNPNEGFSGYINPSPGVRVTPLSYGTGPAYNTNTWNFSPGVGPRTTEPANLFSPMSVTVPNWYNPETGFNNRGFAEPFDVGFNVTNANIDPLAGPITQGGMGQMTIAGSQNAQVHLGDGRTMGFNPQAMPHSNIGLAVGRDFSGLDPARAAAATLALIDQRTRDEEMANASLGAGYGVDGGQRAFARGGRVQTYGNGGRVGIDPLGRPDLVTNEPIIGIGMHSGRPRLMLGEDNADRDRIPDREAVYMRNGGMDIVPLEPFAGGGRVQTQQQQETDPNFWKRFLMTDVGRTFVRPTVWPAPVPFAEGGGIRIGGDTIGTPTLPTPTPTPTQPTGTVGDAPPNTGTDAPPSTPPTTPTTPPVTPPVTPTAPPVTPPVTPPVSQVPPFVDPLAGYDPLNPSLLAPWEALMRRNASQEHLRNIIDNPRRRAAGLGASTGIPVLSGDVPAEQLGAGQFFDTSGQVNRMYGEILGAQSDYRNLGPEEDVSGDLTRVSEIGGLLEDMERIADIELQQQVVMAGVPTAEAIQSMNGQFMAMEEERGRLLSTGFEDSPQMQTLLQGMARLRSQIGEAENARNTALQKQAVYTAQIEALRNRMGPTNEAALRTELARRNENISRQDKRVQNKVKVANLAKIGVPNLGAPVKPLDPLAAAA